MNNYNEEDYPNLYQEILEDAKFRYGKFDPIPYPNYQQLNKSKEESNNNVNQYYAQCIIN